MWSEGTIGIPAASGKYTAVHYWVKYYEEPSEEFGINGGKISKLTLKVDGKIICNYDRGWDTKPTCKEAELTLAILLNNYKGGGEDDE